ncbi:hypothetical protein [Citreimonas salinaria]|uniref:Phage integrase family protein n=1 Tax=Citreimonas salinaria TaxID=321339 RepID=A0A1H3NJ25_9RHOB|nr:hypothetical protein [Citreimonas salinaria]SDY88753.1 hypothetical protein SAMN05444340_1251 [Citreimonas salinaria]
MHELAEELQRHNLHPVAFLTTKKGMPFASSSALVNRNRKWIIGAELSREIVGPDGTKELKATRSQHGIRKRAAHELVEAGASVYEIAAHLLHSDAKSSVPYTRDFNRAKLVESGFDRVEQTRLDQRVRAASSSGTFANKHAAVSDGKVGKWQAFRVRLRTPCSMIWRVGRPTFHPTDRLKNEGGHAQIVMIGYARRPPCREAALRFRHEYERNEHKDVRS